MDKGSAFLYQLNKELAEDERLFKLKSAVLNDDTFLTVTLMYNSAKEAKQPDEALFAKVEALTRQMIPEEYRLTVRFVKTYTDEERVRNLLLEYIYHKSAVLFPKLQQSAKIEVALSYQTVNVRFILPPDLYAFMESNNYAYELSRYLEGEIMEDVEVTLYTDRSLKTDTNIKRRSLESIASSPVRTIKVNVKESVIGVVSRQPRYIIDAMKSESDSETLCGKVTKLEYRTAKNTGKKFYLFRIDDTTANLPVKFFARDDKQSEKFENAVREGVCVAVEGNLKMDTFSKEISLFVKRLGVCEIDYSTIIDKIEYLDTPEEYTHVFPQPFCEQEQTTLFGLSEAEEAALKGTYVIFDLETTGLNATEHTILEIGAVKMVDGEFTETFSTLIDPQQPIPPEASEKNHITDAMVAGQPTLKDVIGDFYKFTRGAVLVAHNATFDLGFLGYHGKELRYNFDNDSVDTLQLARENVIVHNYKLSTLCKHFKIELVDAHRALNDTIATAKLFKALLLLPFAKK